jgi:hypothetical protein
MKIELTYNGFKVFNTNTKSVIEYEFVNYGFLEIEKLEELKVLLSHKMITYKMYLEFFQVTFFTRDRRGAQR